MKRLLIILLFATGCADNPQESSSPLEVNLSDRKPAHKDTVSKKPDTLNIFQYGQAVMDGQIDFNKDLRSWNCLDSLSSKNPNTRQFFFKVYRTISTKSDGALSEALGRVKEYFLNYPDECISNFRQMSEKEKMSFTTAIAFEFYSSGGDYEKEIASYINNLKQKLNPEDRDLVDKWGKELIQQTKEMFD